MSVAITLDTELVSRIETLSKGIEDKALRRILRKAAKPFVEAARSRAPQRPGGVKKRYSTPKLTGRLRAPHGYGKVVATYDPGNLRRSIQNLSMRKLNRAVLIGPRAAKRNNKGHFTGKRVDGYYAHMVEGGTRHSTASPFMSPAWQATKDTVVNNIINALSREIAQQLARAQPVTREIKTGKRGGRYYINDAGTRTYIKRN